jgi:hypothetical protein
MTDESAKTTEFYNTTILVNKLKLAEQATRQKYAERLRTELGEHADAVNDPRLQWLNIWPQFKVQEHVIEDVGLIFRCDQDAYPALDTKRQKLLTKEQIGHFRVLVHLPKDLSRELFVDELRKEFGRDIKKEDFKALDTGSLEQVKYNTFSIPLDKLLQASEIQQGAGRSA